MPKIQYKASLDHLYEMLAQVREASEKASFDPALISRIELALEEALVNIIRYAYPTHQEIGWISIECRPLLKGGLEIIVQDQGISYNPLTYTPDINPSHSLEERSVEGGYGIFFITHLVDEVFYKRENDFNVLTLKVYKKNHFSS